VQECEGETVRLSSNTDGVTYRWFWNNALLPESDSFLIVDMTGTYRVEVTNEGDCTTTDEVDVEFFPLADIDAGMDINYCEGQMASVSATTSSIIYFWYKDGVPYPEDDLSFMTNEPGTYVLEAQNEAECSVFDTIVITEVAAPPVDFGDDIIACIGDMVDLDGPVGNGYEYQWFKDGSPFTTTESISVDENGLYVLVVTDENGCSGEDAVQISFEPGPTLTINETGIELCQGESFTAEVTTNASSVQWFKDGTLINGATGTTFDIDESGTYTAQAEGASGCIVTEDIDVVVNPLPAVALGMDIVECEGTAVTLESNIAGDSYSWQFNGDEISTQEDVQVDQEGTYTLIVTNEFNCQASDEISLTYVPLPTIDLISDAEFCEGESVSLTASSNGATFQWFLDGNPILGATSPAYNASEPGTYEFVATGQGSCTNSQEVIVSEVSAPVVDLGGDVTLCPGESVTLDAGPNAGSTFEWSTGENTSSIELSNDDQDTRVTESVFVDVTNSAGCTTSQTISVTYIPVLNVLVSSSGNGVCTGDSLIINASGAEDYTWDGPGGTFEFLSNSSIVVFPETASEYIVMGSDECPANMDVDTIVVDVFVPGVVSAGNDTCVLIGRSIDLDASGGVSYVWENDPSIESGITTSSPTVMPEVETTYTVTITDSNGCKQSDQVTVCIIDDPLSIFKAVNAITPNGDGFNDELEFPGLEAFETNRLVIYNRWGNVVYQKDGYQTDGFLFSGLRNGEELPADTYYYVLTFDEFVVKETLTIIRPN
jgi:gliding motility-associated-like protein